MVSRAKIESQIREGVKTALKPLGSLEDKVRELVEKVQSQAVKGEDLGKLVKEFNARLQKARAELERSFSEGVSQVMGAMNLATKSDLEALEKKVEKLAKQLTKPAAKPAAKKSVKKAKK